MPDALVPTNPNLLELTAQIVSAHLGHATVPSEAIPSLIQSVYATLGGLGQAPAAAEAERPQPAVPVKRSVQPDHIVCLEDGTKLKMLKRYLATRYQLTPEQYRARWGLPPDYPMVAPAHAERRSTLAKSIGLGRKRSEPDSAPAKAPRRRGKAAEAAAE